MIRRSIYDLAVKRQAQREFYMRAWLDRLKRASTFEEFDAAAAADPRRPGVPIAASVWLGEMSAAGF